jgi:hypothetical protein
MPAPGDVGHSASQPIVGVFRCCASARLKSAKIKTQSRTKKAGALPYIPMENPKSKIGNRIIESPYPLSPAH